jgi:hypothetical protein
MIVEMRTYLLKPTSVPEVVKRFGDAMPERVKLSPLVGFWHTEIGRLNHIIHMWSYKDLAERDRIRAEAVKSGVWPPKIQEFILEMESKILIPAAFSPPLGERKLGLYEIRSYIYGAGSIPTVIKAWSEKIEGRTKLSPLVFAGHTELGPLNNWVHIWAYADLNERARVRAEAVKLGIWPPGSSGMLMKQENWIALPAPFSPLH